MKSSQKKQGFTLIELLVVIAIIGILSAIGLVALNGAREKARDSKRQTDLQGIATALALYYDDNNAYPATPDTATPGPGGDWTTLKTALVTSTPSYAGALNLPGSGGTAFQTTYRYTPSGDRSHYFLSVQLETPVINPIWFYVNDRGVNKKASGTLPTICNNGAAGTCPQFGA